MHSFTFNGHSSDEFGIRIERFPDLNRSERKYKSASVSGRNGNIYQMESAWEEVTVSYQIFAGERTAGAAVTDFTDIVEWLNSADDYAVLTDTYDPAHYRMAVFVDELEIESQWHTFGKATVRFRCRPQRFIVQSPISVNDGDTITNTTNHIAKPIITLTGSGSANLIDLRNKSVYSSGSFISPQLGTFISAYENNKFWLVKPQYQLYGAPLVQAAGTQLGGTVGTITPSNGEINFTANSNGYGVGLVAEVRPDTDYYFQNSNPSANHIKVFVWFGAADGYNKITGGMESTSFTGFTFHTPPDCGYVLIGLFSTSGTSTQWFQIMLSSGTSQRTFQPYVDAIDNTLTINNTTLQFSVTSFGEAVIDCERENFTIDGADANNTSAVVDPYGNMSVDYLQLEKGTNTVHFSGDIASVTVDKRFWQL